MSYAMIGCGRMGRALLTQWHSASAHAFTVITPNSSVPAPARLVRSVDALGDQTFSLIVIGVKPQMIDQVLPAYRRHLREDGVLVSLAAGYSSHRLRSVFGAGDLVRVMPNLPAQIGQGVSGLFAPADVGQAARDRVEALMRAAGSVVWTESEDQLDRLTAVAGCGPGYGFELLRCLVEAAQSLGFSETDARTLVLDTLAGTLALARQSETSLAALRDQVASPNGVTAEGLRALNGDGEMDRRMKTVVEAAYARAVALR